MSTMASASSITISPTDDAFEPRRTLKRRLADIEELQSTGHLEENLTTINKLMDFHDRIEATRSSALNVRSVLDFINSLLLPLLAFILANLDRIRAWIQ